MGVQITELLIKKEIDIDTLKNKVLVVDSYNILYQFLTTIRARDGSLLMDSKNNVTSHLVGLFSRTTKLMQRGLKLIFAFDGEPPALKLKERERRKELKIEAELKYKEAAEKEDIEEMKKYAARTSRLTPKMIEEAKKLVSALGLPVVQAPSEGEAQAAHLVKKDDAFASVSQDFDSLLFSASRLVRNLSIAGRRKTTNKLSYETIKPEIVDLAENLNYIGIDQNQLIALAILVGTDYNPGGIKGIGPKNALKLVKKFGSDFDSLFKEARWDNFFDFPWTDVYYLIKKMPVTDGYKLEWKGIDEDEVFRLLVNEHDFSEERVKSLLGRLPKAEKRQKGLSDFF